VFVGLWDCLFGVECRGRFFGVGWGGGGVGVGKW